MHKEEKEKMTTSQNETNVRHIIAYDNLGIPLSSMHQKIKRRHKDLAVALEKPVDDGEGFGNSIARVKYQNKNKARAMKDAVKEFCEVYPAPGRDLQRLIASKRTMREVYFEYGLEEGRRISSGDYIGAMESTGLSSSQARELYPALLDISRSLQEARDNGKKARGLKKVLIGKSEI